MPGRDGTGPRGLGPVTGRGFGACCCEARRYGGAVELFKDQKVKILEANGLKLIKSEE